MEQIVELAELSESGILFDYPASPIVRAGIAQRAEHPLEALSSIRLVRERQLDWIDRYRVVSPEVAASVDEAAEWNTGTISREHEAACGNELGRPRKHEVDEDLRSHCPVHPCWSDRHAHAPVLRAVPERRAPDRRPRGLVR